MPLTRAGLAGGAMAATAATTVVVVVAGLLGLAAASGHDPDPSHSGHGLANDFYSYWGAGHVLNHGGDPYDQTQLRATYAAADVHPVVGSGYSYPLFFAHLMRPLALLPAATSALLFAALSAAALGIAVALLLGSMPTLSPRLGLIWGLCIGLSPPIAGSLYVGQVNLIVLLLIALAFRRKATGPMLAIAGAIKLFPAAGLLALAVRGRREWRGIVSGSALLAVLLIVPTLLTPKAGFGARLTELVAPDPYWTNVSLNGWLSRLAPRTASAQLFPGRLPVGSLVVFLTIAIGLAVVALLWTRRDRPRELLLGLALLFGVITAPKNSIWNYAPLAACIVAVWPHMVERSLLRRLILTATGLITVGSAGIFLTLMPRPPFPAATALAVLTIIGALLLSGVLIRLLVESDQQPSDSATRWWAHNWLGRARLLTARRRQQADG